MVKSAKRKKNTNKIGTASDALYATVMLLPYGIVFCLLIFIPAMLSAVLSFTYFNMIAFPTWRGLQNFVNILTADTVFFQHVLPNTLQFAIMTGPGGFVLSFFLAWLLAQIQAVPRNIIALCLFSPSLGAGLGVIFGPLFSGNQFGLLNAQLLRFNIINQPIQWWNEQQYIMPLGILLTLWGGLGLGFLAMLAGILNVDEQVYEAAYIDGIRNRFQEIIYVTIPLTTPMMLFAAVMAIAGSFNGGLIMVNNAGNPPPGYAGSVIMSHIQDFQGRMEHGYAAALAIVLFGIVWMFGKIAFILFGGSDR